MAASSRILLQGGTLLLHDAQDHVQPTVSDILIDGATIAKIDKNIAVEDGVQVIDATGKIISPGFISTHHHLYQTPMKGKHSDHTLVEYMPPGNFGSTLYTLEDAFWGQLSGALESIDAGTTTVVDHSSLNNGDDYPKTLVQALITSGLRTVYCYAKTWKVPSWKPFSFAPDMLDEASMQNWGRLAASSPLAGRVYIGFAFDALFLPGEIVKPLYAGLRAGKAHLITSHGVGGVAYPGFPSAAQLLAGHGLLEKDILISHACFPPEGDAELLRKTGATVSSTPNTELQMGFPPVALRPEYKGLASIGVDCHTWGSSSIPGQMRMLLQYARTERANELAKDGKWSRYVGPTVEDVFNAATLAGAKSAGLENSIGRIAEGFKADLVIYSTDSPTMLGAAENNPLVAVVMNSSERDVDTVIVDGIVRKAGGKLLDVEVAAPVDDGKTVVPAGTKLTWKDVAAELLKARSRLWEQMKDIDMEAAVGSVIDGFHMNRAGLLEQK